MSFIKFKFDKEVNSLYAYFNGVKHYVQRSGNLIYNPVARIS